MIDELMIDEIQDTPHTILQTKSCMFLALQELFLKTSSSVAPMLKTSSRKALYGSPKCITIASTSGFKNECRWGW